MVWIRASGPPPNAALILLCAGELGAGRQPGEGHVGVPGDGERRGGAGRGVDMDDLDGVAPLPPGVGGIAELLGLRRRLTGPAVRADQQHVVGLAVGARPRRRNRGWRRPCSIGSGSSRSPARRRRSRTTTSPMATRRSRSAGRRRRFFALRSSRLDGHRHLAPEDGAGELGLAARARRPDRGATRASVRSGSSEERPVGRDPLGVGGSEGWHGGMVSELVIDRDATGRQMVLRRPSKTEQFPTTGAKSGVTPGGGPTVSDRWAPTIRGIRRGPGRAGGPWPPADRRTRWRRGSPGRWRPGWRRRPR